MKRHELNYTQRAARSRLIRSRGQVQHHRAPSHCRSASACCYEDRGVQDEQGEHWVGTEARTTFIDLVLLQRSRRAGCTGGTLRRTRSRPDFR
eukprot:scaffold135345_cov136-Phaeocystis_antarctica.AAC.1